ncbi:MAG: hypothetical protein ABSF61_05405 [Anaerolineales bacterium]|jgi:hypothetical protein
MRSRASSLVVGALVLSTSLFCNLSGPSPAPTTNIAEAVHATLTAMQLNQATGQPQPTATVAVPALGQAAFENVSFQFDPSLAESAKGAALPAISASDPNAPPFAVSPAHIKFSFTGYAHPSNMTPELNVYPVADFSQLSPQAKTEIGDLAKLLSSHNLSAETLPFLPSQNAAQMMHARVSFLAFQNGTGVRYLTQYAQAYVLINNQWLFYTFQGLTSDGKYYVSAVLPVSCSQLSNQDFPADKAQQDQLMNNFAGYIGGVVAQLDGLGSDQFKPPLEHLDSLIQSLGVTS